MEPDDVTLKFQRAAEHGIGLLQTTSAFLDTNPYRVRSQVNPERTQYVFRVEVAADPPDVLTVILGDALQNLRATLEHIVWHLCSRRDNSTGFPIISKRSDWATYDAAGVIQRGNGLYKIRDLDPGAIKVIDGYQPYHRPNEVRTDALWALNKLANVDRHHSLHLLGGQAHTASLSFGLPGTVEYEVVPGLNVSAVKPSSGPYKDGHPILGFGVSDASQLQGDPKCDLAPDVVFADEGRDYPAYGWSVGHTFGGLFAQVEDICESLRPYL